MSLHHVNYNYDSSPFRSPNEVMKPERLGAMHQSRISFSRRLIRRMAKLQWKVVVERWDLSKEGFGTVCYRLETPNNHYHMVIFSDVIDDNERNDRVIAEKWDVTFALVKGDINAELLVDLRSNVPKQEAGRNSSKVLVLARANKSVRVFDHIVESLSCGVQPDSGTLADAGYILRTTAVYGNGKFGIADFGVLEENPDFNLTFSAQMCAVYLLRNFSLDWVHFIAKGQGGVKATSLDRRLQRYLGVGNATGLGMAPYLLTHPRIVDQWLLERESALGEVAVQHMTLAKRNEFLILMKRAEGHLKQVVTIDEKQQARNQQASEDVNQIVQDVEAMGELGVWSEVVEGVAKFSYEAQEVVISCILEIYPECVDKHALNLKEVDQSLFLAPGLAVQDLIGVIENRYQWALSVDFSLPENTHYFWYASEDKEEPRVGVRGQDVGDELEMELDVARQVSCLYRVLSGMPPSLSLSEFFVQYPRFRTISRRVWTMGHSAMGDIQMNVLGKEMLPIDLLRCKLSFLGATKFDPRSDRWLRVTFFQGAPLVDELDDDEWLFPLLSDVEKEEQPTPALIHVSHNEVLSLCAKAFKGLRRHRGEADLVANMVAGLEMDGFDGVYHFAKALSFLAKDRNDPVEIVGGEGVFNADLKGCSILFHLPVLLDVARDSLLSCDRVDLHLDRCHNRWLSYGLLSQHAGEGVSIMIKWNNTEASEHVVCLMNAGSKAPDVFLFSSSCSDQAQSLINYIK